jgi:D-lyxose ketol-isomerase
MKRSEINEVMRSAKAFLHEQRFALPPFAFWSPADWRERGPEVREIVDNRLGWDVTDFGLGDFRSKGLLLFTLRNGNLADCSAGKGRPYAEKVMIVEDRQVTPLHFHWHKREDIINRGGGNLRMRLYEATADEQLDSAAPVRLSVDGIGRTFEPGEVLTLTPGESVSLPQRCYHEFRAEGGRTLVGEVSMVNDDDTDNRFLEPIPRFAAIEEDEEPLHLLANEYGRWHRGDAF